MPRGKAKVKAKPEKKTKVAVPRAVAQEGSKQDRIDALVQGINTKLKRNVLRRANTTSSSYLLRRPTGIISLDIAMGGGFPASTACVIVGPDGVGKDYLLWRTAAESQRLYGDDFNMAIYLTESRLDKPYMRDKCGFKVGMTDEELDELDEARERIGLPKYTDEERAKYQEQIGQVYVIYGVTAEDGFDTLIECVKSNAFQICAINSIGFLQTEAKEATESFAEFPQQRNEAMLISKFMPKLAMTLNADTYGYNETSLLILNQVRAKDNVKVWGRPLQESDMYKPASAAWALKHGKVIELLLGNGKQHIDEANNNAAMGREKHWKITKGKFGTHEGFKGSFNYFYDVGADLTGDLLNTCIALEVVDASGAWVNYDHPTFGFKAHGRDHLRRILDANPELCLHFKDLCFQKAGVVYRHR